ncbi:MAG TPA: glycosyltransferase [Solirubrobacteraceae bacterium]|nr:glycosyltransferase [Solirubrobacteraceae bacterium]
MRIMISTRRGAGHFGPLIPFAKAFLRNNDEIVVTAPAAAAAMIANAGFDHHIVPDPPPHDRDRMFAKARTMDYDAANAYVVSKLFIDIDARAAYPHMLGAIERYEPDVIVLEASEFAAALAAEASGVPAVCVGISQASHMQTVGKSVARALDELRAEFGLEPDPDLDRLNAMPYMTLIPEALEDPSSPGLVEALRFRTEDIRPRALPDWWQNNSWPLVYLTFGTVAPTMDFFPGVYRDAIDALSLLPVRVLVTIGRDRDPRDIGPVGPNVHVARWVPQADVMPHADVMVCHGGSGTVTAGLAAGVPMAVLPLFADQPHNARRVADLGAGIALDNATGIADAVRRLIAEPSYRETAQQIAADIAELPTVDAAARIVHGVAVRA